MASKTKGKAKERFWEEKGQIWESQKVYKPQNPPTKITPMQLIHHWKKVIKELVPENKEVVQGIETDIENYQKETTIINAARVLDSLHQLKYETGSKLPELEHLITSLTASVMSSNDHRENKERAREWMTKNSRNLSILKDQLKEIKAFLANEQGLEYSGTALVNKNGKIEFARTNIERRTWQAPHAYTTYLETKPKKGQFKIRWHTHPTEHSTTGPSETDLKGTKLVPNLLITKRPDGLKLWVLYDGIKHEVKLVDA